MVDSAEGNAATRFAARQFQRWQDFSESARAIRGPLPVITVCMEPGSGGSEVAKTVAAILGFDYFHRELIEVMAIDAKVSSRVLEKQERERLSGIQDLISQVIDDRYLYPGVYFEHLERIVRTIGRRGDAVIVGRGANFILPVAERLAVRIVAPLEHRIAHVAKAFDVLEEDAEKRIRKRETRRASFIRKAFNKTLSDPVGYDLMINTGVFTVEAAADLICSVWCDRFLR